ncbi:hypothetical protein GCM10023210_33370 [Chryseobacterium ginsengisoli]|uniref:Resolvase HTH domain-containing protein n=1 Tax=Chryseobacterium ginsengisoli TaxID=363853 RepID=A0ABP9MMN5_9FLAO
MNLKEIHIGKLITEIVDENKIEMLRICNFFDVSEDDIENMFNSHDLRTDILLKWSKLLKYDFFRLYSQHLMLYAPPLKRNAKNEDDGKAKIPHFRKNIYTKEIIDFMLEMLENKEKTKEQIIKDYNIPKTTLYKWIEKNEK